MGGSGALLWLALHALAQTAPEGGAAGLVGAAGGLDPAAQAFFGEAEAATDPARAASLYRIVLARDPGYLPAALGLARALVAVGDREGAERVYRGLGTEPDAVEGLALLLEVDRPEEAVRLWHSLETLRLGDPTPYLHQARLLAATDPDRALAAWSTYQTLLQGAEPDGAALLAVAEGLLGKDRDAEAVGILRAYVDASPTGAVAEEARARLDRIEVERLAGDLALGGAEPLDPASEARRRLAAKELAAGKVDAALAIARELVAGSPRSDAAHGLYADALIAQGAWTDAEVQAVLARSLAPDVAEHRIRLGQLLLEAYGGRRDAEALEELREASALRSGEPEILYRLGALQQGLRQYDAAEASFAEVVRLGGEDAADAQRRLDQLRRRAPRIDDLPEGRPLALPADAARHYRIALVYLGRGEAVSARAELDAALAIAPAAPILLNLRARMEREAGDLAAAERTLEASLAADPRQGPVLFVLGELALGRGETEAAEARFREAAELGEGDAHYLLAREAARRGDWSRVRTEIAAYRASSHTFLYEEGARGLGAEAARRWWALRIGLALVTLAIVGVPAGIALRRRTARTLRDLLDGAPECWHEAARPLAALRHEVLKHNTTVLPDVAAALEAGDRGPYDAFAARAPEVHARFEAYLAQLEALGRRHGFRVDLRRKDPVLAPMYTAIRRLARASRRRTPPPPAQLRAWSDVINRRGYGEIGRLVNEICILPVSVELLAAVYARVAQEPGFAGGGLPEPELVDTGGVHQVRMFRADLEDILANVIRNALAAGARKLRIALGEDVDPITGHAWVEVRVGDDAPGTLTNAMIRGRYIGRGLGLAVDLLNRHGGSIRVDAAPTPDPGAAWKEVVVQIPAVEAASVEVEWAT